MPTVTYNGHCFLLDRRRVWILGAEIQYARVHPDEWSDRIRAAKDAGFNTIATSCPWIVHEPRKGRFDFSDGADLRAFIERCRDAGLFVMLRPGPYVGAGFDGGGLPPWLPALPGIRLREANEVFLERTTSYMRRVLNEVGDLQATQEGPIILVQSENGWTCTNDDQAARYLAEVTRVLRESGVAVPIINANDLWQEPAGTIDTWRGWEDLLSHVRQLRSVQPGAPRVVSAFEVARTPCWGQAPDGDRSAALVLRHAAEVLASGGHMIVSPFHGGTNFDFLGGRRRADAGGFVTTTAAAGAPLGEAGARGATYTALKRIVTFASHFDHVFAELEADYQPVVVDPSASAERERGASAPGLSVVPLRGSQGRVVFIFSNGRARSTTLLLDTGLRLPVPLGPDLVHWLVVGADLRGSGRLDYVNISPVAIVDRSIVVLYGPSGAAVYLSVNGNPLEATVPTGRKPLVVEHRELTFVICNAKQIDTMDHDGTHVYIGSDGLTESGEPIPAGSDRKVWRIGAGAVVESIRATVPPRGGTARRRVVQGWRLATTDAFIDGSSPRFASLAGPEPLIACGAMTGYGWYRIALRSSSGAKRLCLLPESGDRVHMFLDGEPLRVEGLGPGAESGPFELKLVKGEHILVALADNLGRAADGNDRDCRAGIWGHLHEVKPIRSIKPKIVDAHPIDPFAIRGFIEDRAVGHLSSSRQAVWTFTHRRKAPIILETRDGPRGTWVLNDEVLAYAAGPTGKGVDRLILVPGETEPMKRGKNVLRFAPDEHDERAAETAARQTELYESLGTLTGDAEWGFGKWQPPAASAFRTPPKGTARLGRPGWWKGSFELPGEECDLPVWFDTAGLSKGHLFINGHAAGRYFTATRTGRAVGPQRRLYVPAAFLRTDGPNEAILFDEHGFHPGKTRIVLAATGDLDGD